MKHPMNYNNNGVVAPKREYFACIQGSGCYEFDTNQEMLDWIKKAEDKLNNRNIKRSINIKFKDGTVKKLPLSKAAKINTDKEVIEISKLRDGTYRLLFSSSLIDDFTKVECLEVERNDT